MEVDMRSNWLIHHADSVHSLCERIKNGGTRVQENTYKCRFAFEQKLKCSGIYYLGFFFLKNNNNRFWSHEKKLEISDCKS